LQNGELAGRLAMRLILPPGVEAKVRFRISAFLAALYKGAVCLAFPSNPEGFGIASLEAMAGGARSFPQTQHYLLEPKS
jgi:hypothetical protein